MPDFPVSSEELMQRIKADSKDLKFRFNGYEHPFEVINITELRVRFLLFDNNVSTRSFGAEFNSQRKEQPKTIKEFEKLRGHFWWLAVEKHKSLFAFQTEMPDSKFEKYLFLLIRFASNEYVGLRTIINFFNEG